MSRRQLLPAPCPALADAADRASADPYRARRRLADAARGTGEPGEVVVVGWVYDPDLTRTLLVRHPRFGWLSPGGRLWLGEEPFAGALREVTEETGLALTAVPATPASATATGTAADGTLTGTGPAAAAVLGPATPTATERAYGLAYAFTADPVAPVRPEPGQPARWFPLDAVPPCAAFPLDHLALRRHADHLRAAWTAT